jgi:hypothetical protein
MPELSVTEEQLDRLDAVRTDLETAFVDGYGHVRRRDAVEYLLDTYTSPTVEAAETTGTTGTTDADHAEARVRTALDREVRDEEGKIDYTTLQSVARNTDGVKGSGMSAEEMYEAVVEAKADGLAAGESVDVDSVADAGEEEVDARDAGEDEAEVASDTDAPDGSDGADDSDGVEEADAAGGSGATSNGTESTSEGSVDSNGGGSELQAMMNLLRTHEDKWRKAETGDAPYEVDLPDGGTESARTKDDVKRVLFTNY